VLRAPSRQKRALGVWEKSGGLWTEAGRRDPTTAAHVPAMYVTCAARAVVPALTAGSVIWLHPGVGLSTLSGPPPLVSWRRRHVR
jgi:hypothetical protein